MVSKGRSPKHTTMWSRGDRKIIYASIEGMRGYRSTGKTDERSPLTAQGQVPNLPDLLR